MNYKITQLILTVLIFIPYYGVNSEKLDQELVDGPTKTTSSSAALPETGYIIQQVTNGIHSVGQIYYFRRKSFLLYPNRGYNGSVYVWFPNNGMIRHTYYKEISEELLATVIPIRADENTYIFGSDRNLRLCSKNNTDYTISEPLIHFEDPGFVIYSAHCDRNGIMFILLISTEKGRENLGKFYKIKNKKAELVRDLNTMPRDFRFNSDYTSFFMVHQYGRKIADLKYDLKTAELGNLTEVFDMDEYPELKDHFMTSVVVDKKPGHLWVTAAGKEGYVLEINPFEKKLVSITPVPNKDLTFITFGPDNYKSLFVGSKSTCAKGEAQGTIYAISGMGRDGSTDSPIEW